MQAYRLWVFSALLSVMTGCYGRNDAKPPPPPEAFFGTPIRREVTETIEFTGTTRASARVELRAQVSGMLEKINFRDGAQVNEGDVLFIIERAPFEAKKQMADAGLQRAKATLKKAELAVARADRIFKQNAGTESDLENTQAQRETAAADVAGAEAEVKNADLQLNYTEIKAPISGRISRHLVDRGNLVQAQVTELATIESIDPIHVYFSVSERELLRLMELVRTNVLPDPNGTPPKIFMGLVSDPGFPYEGFLDYREFGVDPNTGTILRRAEFPNRNGVLIPGLFARIQAPLGKPKDQLLVNETAVSTDQKGEFLLLIGKENKVQKRYVNLGETVDVRAEGPARSELQPASGAGFAAVTNSPDIVRMRVVLSGVSESDKVIVKGLQTARADAVVVPKPGQMGPEPIGSENGDRSATATGDAEGKPAQNKEAPPPTDAAGQGTPDNPMKK